MQMSIQLPPRATPTITDFSALVRQRRSVREFSSAAVSLEQVAYVLTVAGEITGDSPHRRAIPSAGGLQTLTIYLAASRVTGLNAGIWRYQADTASLTEVSPGDPWPALKADAAGLRRVHNAPAAIFLATTAEAAVAKYGERAHRYVQLEAGHCGQNICLAAVALGLGAVTIGQFDDAAYAALFQLPPAEAPAYLLPFGVPAN